MSIVGSTPKQKETEAEKAAADVGLQKWARYTSTFAPLNKQFISRVASFGGPADRAKSVGDSVIAARQAQGLADINPNSVGTSATRGVSDALSLSQASTAGENANTERQLSGMKSVVDLGAGIDSGAVSNLTRQAQQENALERAKVLRDADSQANVMSGIGTLAGLGIGRGLNEGWFGEDAKQRWRDM